MPRIGVPAEAGGSRLDAFVAGALSCSAGAARRLIEAGLVTVDGRRAPKGYRLQPGQVLEVTAPDAAAGPLPDAGPPLQVLHVDDDLVAVSKPAGMPSHPLKPGEHGTVANLLVARFPECAGASVDPREGGLGHRLDRDTSGVLLAARRREAWVALRAALAAPDCQKTYLAEVFGVPSPTGTVDLPIGHAGRHGARVRLESGRGILSAHTEWTLLETRADSSLIRATLHAGRRHQVRIHLASAGYPILGDELYGSDESRAASVRLAVTSLRLHAETVRLRHPITGRPLQIAAPPPSWAAGHAAP